METALSTCRPLFLLATNPSSLASLLTAHAFFHHLFTFDSFSHYYLLYVMRSIRIWALKANDRN